MYVSQLDRDEKIVTWIFYYLLLFILLLIDCITMSKSTSGPDGIVYIIIRALSKLHGRKHSTVNMFTQLTACSKKLARWYRRYSWGPVVNSTVFVHCSTLLLMLVVTLDNRGLIPRRGTNIYLCYCVQTVSGDHSALYPSIKAAWAWSWPLLSI